MSDKQRRHAADQKPAAEMFPAADDTPLISGTPVPVTVPALTRLTAVDPAEIGGDQGVLFVVETEAFDPAAILDGLSSGQWAARPQGRVVAGYHHAITTGGVAAGRVYPVALAVSEADAAVLAQAKHLLRLVVVAFGVPANMVNDPAWEAFRLDARLTLEACRTKKAPLPAPAEPPASAW